MAVSGRCIGVSILEAADFLGFPWRHTLHLIVFKQNYDKKRKRDRNPNKRPAH